MKGTTLARYVLAYSAAAAIGGTGGWLATVANRSSHGPPVAQGGGMTVIHANIPTLEGSFRIRGNISGLVPGEHRSLKVRVANPNDWRIRLMTLTVVAGNAAPGCPAKSNLHVGSYDVSRPDALHYVVPSRGVTMVPLPIRLHNAARRNQDLCKNVVFPMRYYGTASAPAQPLSVSPP